MTMTDRQRYLNAMSQPDGFHTAFQIERKHGLEGYPPELVTVGLLAIENGDEPHEAIDKYINDVKD